MKTICIKNFNPNGLCFYVGESYYYIDCSNSYLVYDDSQFNIILSPETFREHFETKSHKRIRIIDSL